jgi:hypothetical protein
MKKYSASAPFKHRPPPKSGLIASQSLYKRGERSQEALIVRRTL